METKEIGFDVNSLKSCSGYFKSTEKLKASASGGMATAIAEGIIRSGGCVFGVKYSPGFRHAEYCVVDSIKDLDLIKGSKYVESRKHIFKDGQYASVYTVLEEKLKSGCDVLFIGLGCMVGAVLSFCRRKKINTDRLFTIDLVCHGTASPEIAKQFLDQLERKYRSKITEFSVRYKKEGWVPPYLRAVFESGEIYEERFYETDYGKAFQRFTKASCYDCRFRGKNHKADLTVGDYWGIDKEGKEYHPDGVSIAFLNHEERGNALLEYIDKDEFEMMPADTARALRQNPNYYKDEVKSKRYDQFVPNLTRHGLHYAVVHSVPLIQRIKNAIKRILLRG